jgi:hypothetical protein
MALTVHSDTTNGSYIQTEGGKIAPTNRRNYLINGNFDSWQYATSQTNAGYGSDDRWNNFNSGSTKTHSQVACTDTERALFSSSKFSRTVVSSIAGAGNYVLKTQGIENVTLLAGKTVTLSFWAKADGNKNIAIEFYQNFGYGGSPSIVVTGIGSQLVSLTNTWQKKTITLTVPSIVGKTLGTDGVHTSSFVVNIWFDAGSNYNARAANLGQQSGTFDIAQVKLEDGSVATDGWHPYDGEFGGEVQACQRYYEVFNTSFIASYAVNGNNLGGYLSFLTPKRVSPTLVVAGDATSHTNVNVGISYQTAITKLGFVEYRVMQGTAGAMQFSTTFTASAEL